MIACAAAACMRSRPRIAASRAAQRAFAGRPLSFEVSENRDHGGLVDRHPPRDHVAERLDARGGVAGKSNRRLGGGETTGLREPHRKREVLQRDHRLHAVLPAGAHDVGVVRERVRVEPPGLRLDASPLDREAMRVVVHRPELCEILAVAPVVIDRDRRVASAGDRLGMIGDPPRPVVVDAALDLMRRGGAPQEESVGQTPRRHPLAAGASRTRRRYPSDGSSTISFTPFLRLHCAHREGVLGDRRTDLETTAGLESRVRPAHALERTRLGAQLLRAAEIEHGGFSHDAVPRPARRRAVRITTPEYGARSCRGAAISPGPAPGRFA